MGPRERVDAFGRGVVAALLAGCCALAVRLAWGVPSPAELTAEAATTAMPLPLFAALLGWLEAAARPLLLALVLTLQCVVGGLIAVWARPRSRGAALAAGAVLWLVTWLLAGGFVRPGFPSGGLLTPGVLASLVPFGLYAAILAGASRRPPPAPPAELTDAARRRLLVRLAMSVGASVGFGFAGSALSLAWLPPAVRSGRRTPITPNAEFYVVSKSLLGDPTIDPAGWGVLLRGAAGQRRVTLDELRALPSVEEIATLVCISNEVGGDLIGTARWRGVPLAALLDLAGGVGDARLVAFYAADGYSDSVPVERALAASSLLVYEMNGEPLPQRHGAPARVLVPGLYGIKQVKWVTAVAAESAHTGYWQARGWSRDGIVNTLVRIDRPDGREAVGPGPLVVEGVAYAGDRGVRQVEVSSDGGRSWASAQLEPVAPAPFVWTLWRWEWPARAPGAYRLVARAVDGTGARQPASRREPLPDGATGYHVVEVRVVG